MASKIEVLEKKHHEEIPPEEGGKKEKEQPKQPERNIEGKTDEQVLLESMSESLELEEVKKKGFFEEFSKNAVRDAIVTQDVESFFIRGLNKREFQFFYEKIISPSQEETVGGLSSLMIRIGLSNNDFVRDAQEFLFELAENKPFEEIRINPTKSVFLDQLNSFLDEKNKSADAKKVRKIYEKISQCKKYNEILDTTVSEINNPEKVEAGEKQKELMTSSLVEDSNSDLGIEELNEVIQKNQELAKKHREFGLTEKEFIFLLYDTESLEHKSRTTLMLDFLKHYRSNKEMNKKLEKKFKPVLESLSTTVIRHPFVQDILLKINHQQEYLEWIASQFRPDRENINKSSIERRHQVIQAHLEFSQDEETELGKYKFPKAVNKFAERTVLQEKEAQYLIMKMVPNGETGEIRKALQLLDKIEKKGIFQIDTFNDHPEYLPLLLNLAENNQEKEGLILKKLAHDIEHKNYTKTIQEEVKFQDELIEQHENALNAIKRIKSHINKMRKEGNEIRDGYALNEGNLDVQDSFTSLLKLFPKLLVFMSRKTTEIVGSFAATIGAIYGLLQFASVIPALAYAPVLIVTPLLYAIYKFFKAKNFSEDKHTRKMDQSASKIDHEIQKVLPKIIDKAKSADTRFKKLDPNYAGSEIKELSEVTSEVGEIHKIIQNRDQSFHDPKSFWTNFYTPIQSGAGKVSRLVSRYMIGKKGTFEDLKKQKIDVHGYQGDYNASFNNLFDCCDRIIDDLKAEIKKVKASKKELQKRLDTEQNVTVEKKEEEEPQEVSKAA